MTRPTCEDQYAADAGGPPRVCVVGSGTAFVSGITYYTDFLARALAVRNNVSVVLMRRLIPRRLYPGRSRVGLPITNIEHDYAPTFDGVDWFAIPSVPRAMRFIRHQRPDVVVLQWWSGSVLPWYLIFAWQVRGYGGHVVLEFHEDLDTGEAAIPVLGAFVRRGLRRLIAMSSQYVVHSSWDRERLTTSLALPPDKVTVIPHGPFPMARRRVYEKRVGDDAPTNILFFGTIRPYKGLEILVRAFARLPREAGQQWHLTVVGETWEGWTLPLELIAGSPYRSDIDLVNRYVSDEEIPAFFAGADVVALPYLRSSASGPLHLTMTTGLPVVVSRVGGLAEAARDYTGAFLVEPDDVDSLIDGLTRASREGSRLERHEDPHSWANVADLYELVIKAVGSD